MSWKHVSLFGITQIKLLVDIATELTNKPSILPFLYPLGREVFTLGLYDVIEQIFAKTFHCYFQTFS